MSTLKGDGTDVATFDEVSAIYDDTLPSHVMRHYRERRAALFRRHFPRRSRVLDVDCGTGVLAARLAIDGFLVTGVDASDGLLVQARAKGARVVQASAGALPWRDAPSMPRSLAWRSSKRGWSAGRGRAGAPPTT